MPLCRQCPKYKIEKGIVTLQLCITGTKAKQVDGNNEACEIGKKLIEDRAKEIYGNPIEYKNGAAGNLIMEITILGEPVSCLRARICRNRYTGKSFAFTPAKTANYKEYLKGVVNDHYKGIVEQGAILMGIKVFRSIPKGFSQKKVELAEQGIIRPVSRPDIDNYIKGICDSLRSIIWRDDSQVVGFLPDTGKWYSKQPRIEIRIERLGGGDNGKV